MVVSDRNTKQQQHLITLQKQSSRSEEDVWKLRNARIELDKSVSFHHKKNMTLQENLSTARRQLSETQEAYKVALDGCERDMTKCVEQRDT